MRDIPARQFGLFTVVIKDYIEGCKIYKEGRYCRPQDIMEWLKQPLKGE